MFNPQPKNKAKRLRGKAYTEFRKSVYREYGGICASCGVYAPLNIDGVFDLYYCGHVHHKKTKGAGGQDCMSGVEWICSSCHMSKHGPMWSKGTEGK